MRVTCTTLAGLRILPQTFIISLKEVENLITLFVPKEKDHGRRKPTAKGETKY